MKMKKNINIKQRRILAIPEQLYKPVEFQSTTKITKKNKPKKNQF